jgi:hypothetical protein
MGGVERKKAKERAFDASKLDFRGYKVYIG